MSNKFWKTVANVSIFTNGVLFAIAYRSVKENKDWRETATVIQETVDLAKQLIVDHEFAQIIDQEF